MRKAHKKLLLEIFDSLHEAHTEIKKLMTRGADEEARALMAQCQDAAVDIGTTIDDLEGDGTAAVKYLEEYCEALYQVHEGIIADLTGNKAFTLLEEKLRNAENSLKKDIKTKLEIAFMPYKSSMWDSLETIWRAADADPDCDAYVVPIPYYERNPDFSFGDFHYEGRDLPGYVPVVHYENYDLEERRPDIIYIHNPYDDHNYVTSVDPRFYSTELKKYTDMLVYVPYLLCEHGCKDYSPAQKSLPQVADRVAAIEPELLEIFKKEYIITHGSSPLAKRQAEQKFFYAKSPKLDKLLTLTAQNTNIPTEWLKKAEGKKVVFYNTCLNGLLSDPQCYIGKIRRVINFFSSRNDCLLLWRPHPLIESTIHSLAPQFADGFAQIKQRFISTDQGIYDDTPDPLKAIFLSDMIYGDISSVAWQFDEIGLPSLYQKVTENDSEVLEKWITSNEKKKLPAADPNFVSNGEKIHHIIKTQAINL